MIAIYCYDYSIYPYVSLMTITMRYIMITMIKVTTIITISQVKYTDNL